MKLLDIRTEKLGICHFILKIKYLNSILFDGYQCIVQLLPSIDKILRSERILHGSSYWPLCQPFTLVFIWYLSYPFYTCHTSIPVVTLLYLSYPFYNCRIPSIPVIPFLYLWYPFYTCCNPSIPVVPLLYLSYPLYTCHTPCIPVVTLLYLSYPFYTCCTPSIPVVFHLHT